MSTAPATTPTPHPNPDPLGIRLALLNLKGGVGKTTVTVELAAALARTGHRVLVIDCDYQGNATRRLRATPTPAGTIAQMLETPTKGCATDYITTCGWTIDDATRIDVIPSSLDLADREREAARPGSDRRLSRALFGVTDDYDYTLIDSHPAFGHVEEMTVSALNGPDDGYVIVVEAAHDAIRGARTMIANVDAVAEDMDINGGVTCRGVIVNLVDNRTRLHADRITTLAPSLTTNTHPTPPPVLTPYLRRIIRLATLHDLALPSTGDKDLAATGMTAAFDELARKVRAL